jgi:hypothetical protein
LITNPAFAAVSSLKIVKKNNPQSWIINLVSPGQLYRTCQYMSASPPEFLLPSAFSVTLPHMSRGEAHHPFTAMAINAEIEMGTGCRKRTVTGIKMQDGGGNITVCPRCECLLLKLSVTFHSILLIYFIFQLETGCYFSLVLSVAALSHELLNMVERKGFG